MFDFLNAPEILCYDGEEDAAAAAAAAADPADPTPDKKFSQDDLNKFLAEDRRKHEAKLKTLETSYEKRLEDKSIDAEGRQQLEVELEDLRSQFRTKEQQAEHEKKLQAAEYETKLTASQEAAQWYQGLYTDFVIENSIKDAATAHEAFNDAHIVGLLRPNTKLQDVLDENGNATGKLAPVVKFQDVDAEGKAIERSLSPADAVKRMKELPHTHGCLFRANVVSGVGQGAATGGVTPGQGAQIDVTKLTTEQYLKIRKENPALLGLKPK